MAETASLNPPAQEDRRKAALDASWERRRADVTTRIELSALNLFLERGIDEVTVEEIAAAAGISRRSFYRYFESPAAILSAVLCRALDRWARIVRGRPTHESLLVSFRAADLEMFASPQTSEVVTLALGVMRRSPQAWRRITGPVQAYTTNAYQEIIAERLRALGRDTRGAGAVAAGLTAMMINLAEYHAREGGMLAPGAIEEAIQAFRVLFGNDGE